MPRTRKIPEGWAYDSGDPSVGIWPFWEHETCAVEYDKGVEDASEQRGPDGKDGYADFRWVLTCGDCGKSAVFWSKEFVGLDEPEPTTEPIPSIEDWEKAEREYVEQQAEAEADLRYAAWREDREYEGGYAEDELTREAFDDFEEDRMEALMEQQLWERGTGSGRC